MNCNFSDMFRVIIEIVVHLCHWSLCQYWLQWQLWSETWQLSGCSPFCRDVCVCVCARLVVVFLALLFDVFLPVSDPFIKGTLCALWGRLSASFSRYDGLFAALLCLLKVGEEHPASQQFRMERIWYPWCIITKKDKTENYARALGRCWNLKKKPFFFLLHFKTKGWKF